VVHQETGPTWDVGFTIWDHSGMKERHLLCCCAGIAMKCLCARMSDEKRIHCPRRAVRASVEFPTPIPYRFEAGA